MTCLGVKYESINVKTEMRVEEQLVVLPWTLSDHHVGHQRAETMSCWPLNWK